jgi:tetratricopeptide (TPR) repeat protein
LEIASFDDRAFIEENLSISVDTKSSPYPFLTEAIKAELERQIEKDGFTIDEQNASYRLGLELLSHDKSVYYNYEPIYGYSHIKCTPNKECYRIPIVKYIPCLNISKNIHLMVSAFDMHKNKTEEFPLTDKQFANNCHYGLGSSYGFSSDVFLSNSINRENIISLAKKIKNSLFPVKTIQKEKLLDEVKSVELSQNEIEIFKKSYKMASEKKYEEAIFGFEELKQLTSGEIPYEIYLNLGFLYEYTGDLDKALQNYEHLSDAEEYIKRIHVKKRYAKK